jgi:putative N6-adenine-specific DNA methylase
LAGWARASRERARNCALARDCFPAQHSAVQIFAVAAPGLEPILAAELRALGIPPQMVVGGVEWQGDTASLMHALLHVRTASRVLVRAASFRARTFFELERHARRVPWAQFIPPGGRAALRITARKSKLYHEGAIAERLQSAIALTGAAAERLSRAPDDDDEVVPGAQLFVVRVLRDEFTISADAAGAALHRRGYRQALARAPLRETMAAALLRSVGWQGDAPLLDPLCGSGTIPIEAALLARRIPPALANPGHEPRAFAFTAWPEHDAHRWAELVAHARADILPRATAPIGGSDHNAGAITAARANAERAGVAEDVAWRVERLERAHGHPGSVIVTNPPYGVRVVTDQPPRAVYGALGDLARRLPAAAVALLSPEPALDASLRLPLREVARTRNGGIPVRMLVGELAKPAASPPDQ